MKIVVISDVHGRDLWKKQVEEEADLYIFLGDYFDSFDIPHEIQISNFLDIKKFYEDKEKLKYNNFEKVEIVDKNVVKLYQIWEDKHIYKK